MNTHLNNRQLRFIDYYLQTGNDSEAARRAGYSKKFAGQNANKLLKNKEIAAAIRIRAKEASSKRVAEMREILEFLSEVLRGKTTEKVTIFDETSKCVIKTINKNPCNRDRLKAAEMLIHHIENSGCEDATIINFCFDRVMPDESEDIKTEYFP